MNIENVILLDERINNQAIELDFILPNNDNDEVYYKTFFNKLENDLSQLYLELAGWLSTDSKNIVFNIYLPRIIENVCNIDFLSREFIASYGYLVFIKEQTNKLLDLFKACNLLPDKKPQQAKPLHYKTSYNKNTLKAIFKALIAAGYLSSAEDLESWYYVWGKSTKDTQPKPINWLKSQYQLGVLVKEIPYKVNNVWKIAKACFTYQGKQINVNSIKTGLLKKGIDSSDYKDTEVYKLIKYKH